MHPRMMSRSAGRGECGCGPREAAIPWFGRHRHYDPGPPFGGGPFGVRRPLRFLTWKLGLRDEQTAELAAILNDLKTERAQHEVDDRRSLTRLAELIAAETFDTAKADEAARLRVESVQRLQAQVVRAAARIHALLDAEQRSRLAYLIRSGALAM